MIRRPLTLKRVDPWSVLKFGFVINIALMLVAMLGLWILWIVIGRLGLVDQFCDSVGSIVLDLQECSLNGGNIFRTLLVLGLLGVVVQTGLMVFGAFLYNLIADLTGGLGFTFLDESGDAVRDSRSFEGATSGTGAGAVTGRDTPGARTGAAAGAASSAASSSSSSSTTPRSARPGGPPDQSSAPRERTPDGPPTTPASGDGGTGPRRDAAPSSPGSDRPNSSGSSLWGDPTRSNDRT